MSSQEQVVESFDQVAQGADFNLLLEAVDNLAYRAPNFPRTMVVTGLINQKNTEQNSIGTTKSLTTLSINLRKAHLTQARAHKEAQRLYELGEYAERGGMGHIGKTAVSIIDPPLDVIGGTSDPTYAYRQSLLEVADSNSVEVQHLSVQADYNRKYEKITIRENPHVPFHRTSSIFLFGSSRVITSAHDTWQPFSLACESELTQSDFAHLVGLITTPQPGMRITTI